jgi:2-aminoethylphosphonate dioxygenase
MREWTRVMIDRTASVEEVARLQRDGYLVARNFFNAAEVGQLLRWTEELQTAPEVSGRHWVYREDSVTTPGKRVIQRIENFCPYHEGFDRAIREGPLVRWTAALMGGPVVLFKDKINFKMPGGAGFKAHQDQQAGWSAYASLFITVLLGIDDATPENGCLEVVAGAHRQGLIGEEWKPIPDDVMARLPAKPLPTRRGDVVFFDSYVPHASQPNLTDRPRRVLYVTYNRAAEGDQRARYYADKHRNFPPDIEREPGKTYVFKV